MVVEITMHFFGEPTDAERQGTIKAAMKLAKNPASVSVAKSPESPKVLLAVFRMKNEAGKSIRVRSTPLTSLPLDEHFALSGA